MRARVDFYVQYPPSFSSPHDHPSPGTTLSSDGGGKVSLLLENTVYNLSGVIAKFQQGLRTCDFKDGDLGARNGHMHIVKEVASTFSDQAMVLAAAQGHLEMVQWLHQNRREGTTVDALDLAATFGRLEVVKWLHENRGEGCTTRAMDGAARNNHLDVRKKRHASSFYMHVCGRDPVGGDNYVVFFCDFVPKSGLAVSWVTFIVVRATWFYVSYF